MHKPSDNPFAVIHGGPKEAPLTEAIRYDLRILSGKQITISSPDKPGESVVISAAHNHLFIDRLTNHVSNASHFVDYTSQTKPRYVPPETLGNLPVEITLFQNGEVQITPFVHEGAENPRHITCSIGELEAGPARRMADYALFMLRNSKGLIAKRDTTIAQLEKDRLDAVAQIAARKKFAVSLKRTAFKAAILMLGLGGPNEVYLNDTASNMTPPLLDESGTDPLN